MERFGLSHLFEDQVEPPSSPLYWALGAILAVLLLISLYIHLQADQRYAEHRLERRLAHRYTALIGGFSGLGFAAAIFSLLAVPFLSKRVWLAVAFGGLLTAAVHMVYYFRGRYRTERLKHEALERRRRSLPRPKAGIRRRRGRRR